MAYYFFHMNIGEIIKNLRKSAKMTQVQLAEELGTIQKVISDYEHGRAKPPRDRLPSIAKIFGVSIDQLLGCEDISEKNKPLNKNKRAAKMIDVFEKLTPNEQRLILKQTEALAEARETA